VPQMFALAAECAYTGNYLVAPDDCLDLWALAAGLQVGSSVPLLCYHCQVLHLLNVDRH
jgi:hypothetical protein